jgi:hypothetical protein
MKCCGKVSNPFQVAPTPIPIKGWNPLASEIFESNALQNHLLRNSRWIKARPRTTKQIHNALFPEYDRCGMDREEIMNTLNAMLWDEGYIPSDNSDNPTWT